MGDSENGTIKLLIVLKNRSTKNNVIKEIDNAERTLLPFACDRCMEFNRYNCCLSIILIFKNHSVMENRFLLLHQDISKVNFYLNLNAYKCILVSIS